MPLLIPLKVNSNEYIYKKGESPNFGTSLSYNKINWILVYFLLSGRVNLVSGTYDVSFKTFISGSYFGETEIIDNCLRIFSVKTEIDSDLLVLGR